MITARNRIARMLSSRTAFTHCDCFEHSPMGLPSTSPIFMQIPVPSHSLARLLTETHYTDQCLTGLFRCLFMLRVLFVVWVLCHTSTFSCVQPQDWKAGRVFSRLHCSVPTHPYHHQSSLLPNYFFSFPIIGIRLLWTVF